MTEVRLRQLKPFLLVATASIVGFALRGLIGVVPRAQGAAPRAVDVQGQWVSVGPLPDVRNAFAQAGQPTAPFSGRIGSIAVDPTDLSHWLLGVGNGGVWETRDAGGTWIPLTNAAPTQATGDVTFDPTNPQTIYVGTGEAHGGGMAMGGVGILKSTDAGETWTVLGASSFGRGSVKRLRVNPAKPSELIAASTRGGFGRQAEDLPLLPPLYGVLKSSDAGQTWVRSLAGQATALEIDPANFNRQYAAIGENMSGQGAEVAANGVYRSTDAGQHWDLIAGPWDASSPTQSATGRIELALAPSNANVVYASVSQADGSRILGLYRTDNAWDDAPAWRQISIAQTNAGADSPSGQPGTYCAICNYAHVLSVHPTDPNMVFAGGKAFLWRCTNCAAAPQWANLSFNNPTDTFADQQTIAWAGSRLILGNDGGVFSTLDRGATWQNHNASLPTVMFYIGALHPTDPGFMIGGTRDHGLTVRRDGSLLWTHPPTPQNINTGDPGGEGDVALSSRHPETDWMLAGAGGGAIHRTIDGGRTATRADTGIGSSAAGFLTPVRKCPFNDDVFLTGRAGQIWRTDNFFSSSQPSWSLNGPSANGAATTSPTYAITFAPSDTNCNSYAYGNSAGEIRVTRDGGKTWVNPDPPNRKLPVRAINSIAFDPTTTDTLYVALSNFNPAPPGRIGHIYKTTNASSAAPAWANVGPSEDVPFNVVVVDPRNANLVYAGSDTGLWVSGDAGSTWQKMGWDRGLTSAAVYDIEINQTTNQTVVFTHGRGAFQLATSATTTISSAGVKRR
jgi:photosystem II stability/assembly factor-like uncharacterized protein